MKKALSLVLALVVVCALAACGGSPQESPPPVNDSTGGSSTAPSSSGTPASPASPINTGSGSEHPWNPDNIGNHTFVLAHGLPATGMTGQQYNAFCVAVEELSDGKMVIDQRVGGTLLLDTETLDAVMIGTVDFVHTKGSFISGTVTDISPLTIAGYYGGDDWFGFCDEIRDLVGSIYADYGIKYLGALYDSTSCIASAKRPIAAPSDVAGMTFRVSGTWLSKSVEAWGGAATTIALADLADAFNRGTVEGVMTSWGVIVPFKIYEVCEYITTTNLAEGFAALLMNEERWNELNADEQALLEYAGRVFEVRAFELANEFTEAYIKECKESGRNQVTSLTPESEQEFVRLAYSLFPAMEETVGSKGKELINILRRINGIT